MMPSGRVRVSESLHGVCKRAGKKLPLKHIGQDSGFAKHFAACLHFSGSRGSVAVGRFLCGNGVCA